MLGLLLLQVLASCLCLGHSEVVTSFKTACTQFFYEKTPPGDSLRPTNAARICQVYDNKYRFATLYDRNRRIPVYSAYIYKPGPGTRYPSWFVEPQVINQNYGKDMDTEETIEDEYTITLEQIGQNQATTQDYNKLQNLEKCPLTPSDHRSGDDSKWATYTLTNTVPLNSRLDQAGWRDYMEKTMAQKTQGCDTTYVITGAVPGNSKIPSGRVNVPSHIWSAACCLVGNNPTRAWGAIADNDKNQVEHLNLGQLENWLTNLYKGRLVTLFNKACPRQ
ncbi:ENDD1 protein, partial [Copsychus sechellarum]|nr:ENDD1 protein [Copsychus sechellarum]